jgi:hypothetical protein
MCDRIIFPFVTATAGNTAVLGLIQDVCPDLLQFPGLRSMTLSIYAPHSHRVTGSPPLVTHSKYKISERRNSPPRFDSRRPAIQQQRQRESWQAGL